MAEIQQRLTREEVAKEEIGRTSVPAAVSMVVVSCFLASLSLVPLIQHFDETSQFMQGARPTWVPQCYSILKSVPGSWEIFRAAKGSMPGRVITANRHFLRKLSRYEATLEEASWLTRVFLPEAQWVLTRWLQVGNEKVYLGRDGWLFYRPDVDYLTESGFLSARHIAARLKSSAEWDPVPQPDPIKAIVEFDEQLKTRGTQLIVMPTPMKPMIHPERLAGGFWNPGSVVQNVSFTAFMDRLREKGIPVFDCSSLLAEQYRSTGQPQYLASDTHWRAEAMGHVAKELAGVLQASGRLSATSFVRYRQEPSNLSSVGDTRAMLKLPEGRGPTELETVRIQQVLSPDDELWKADRNAEVLVLGDSFSTIFSVPSMGWGESAGFAEQLAFYLQRPVDRIVQNDNGAFATREALLRERTDGGDRLAGKRVLVWQFAARELAFGDWRVFPMTPGVPGQAGDPRSAPPP